MRQWLQLLTCFEKCEMFYNATYEP
jgi:hypothetical protein